MCKQILHDVPQGPPLTLCSSLAITCLAFIGCSSCTGYWALEYQSLPGCLEVINSQPRVLFGPTSAEIKNKKAQCEEAPGGSHFTSDDITSNILALRSRQGHGWLARLHGARAKDPLLMLWTNPAHCPAVCWIGSRPLGVIYLQNRIDRLCVFTPLFTPCDWHFSDAQMLPLWSVADGLFLLVAVLRDAYGLFLLSAAWRHVLCHWYEGLVSWTAIHVPRCLFTNQKAQCIYTGLYAPFMIAPVHHIEKCIPILCINVFNFLKQQQLIFKLKMDHTERGRLLNLHSPAGLKHDSKGVLTLLCCICRMCIQANKLAISTLKMMIHRCCIHSLFMLPQSIVKISFNAGVKEDSGIFQPGSYSHSWWCFELTCAHDLPEVVRETAITKLQFYIIKHAKILRIWPKVGVVVLGVVITIWSGCPPSFLLVISLLLVRVRESVWDD